MRNSLIISLFMVGLLLYCAPSAMAENDYSYDVAYGWTGSDPLKPPRCCTTAYSEGQDPEWVAPFVERLRREKGLGHRHHKHLLFKPSLGRQYFAVIWRTDYRYRFELYRIAETSQGHRAVGIIDEIMDHPSISAPTGTWVNANGASMLVVTLGSGSSYTGHHLRIFRLGKVVREVTPTEVRRPIRVQDLDGSGRYRVIASEDRWGNFFQTCSGCGPLIPIVLEINEGGYRPACRKARAYYEEGIRRTREFLDEKAADERYLGGLDERTYIALMMAQMGDVDAGRRYFLKWLDVAVKAVEREKTPGDDKKHVSGIISAAENTFPAVFDEASRFEYSQCPLSAVDLPGNHPGAVARARHFRFNSND